MKIELTDKQVDTVLEYLSLAQLYTYLVKNPERTFKIFISLLTYKFNDERHINILKDVLTTIPIQKELF